MGKTTTRHLRGGFTLVEIMVASAILLLGTALVFSAAFALQLAGKEERIQNELERNAAAALDFLQRDIARASAVLPTYAGQTSSANTIVLAIPTFDENEVQVPGVFEYVVFRYDPEAQQVERLELSSDAGTPQVLSYRSVDHVTDCEFFFEHLDFASYQLSGKGLENASSIEISLTVEQERNGEYFTREFSSSATLRNRI